MTSQATITFKTRPGATMIGVFGNGQPLGRVYDRDGKFFAHTNKRAVGSSLIGSFPSRDEAGRALAGIRS